MARTAECIECGAAFVARPQQTICSEGCRKDRDNRRRRSIRRKGSKLVCTQCNDEYEYRGGSGMSRIYCEWCRFEPVTVPCKSCGVGVQVDRQSEKYRHTCEECRVGADGYKQELDPSHPLSNSRGIVRKHRKVVYDFLGGELPQECFWCKELIHSWDDIVIDHLDSDPGNNDIENLVVAHRFCNAGRSVAIKFLESLNAPLEAALGESLAEKVRVWP